MYSSYAVAAAGCSIIFPVIAAVAVGLRLRARVLKSLPFGSDDFLVIVAAIFAIAEACIVFYGSFEAGIGQQLSTMTPIEFTNYQKHLFFDVIVAHCAIGIVKMSVLQLYKRIFSTKRFRLWANTIMAVVILWTLGAFLTQIFSAWPISNWWTKQAGYDLNYGAFITGFAAIDILLDLVILTLPLPVIKSLHMSRKRKFSVIGIFWLGGFCVIAAAVRLYFSYALTAGTDTHPTDDYFSYVSVNNVIWSLIEPCASILAACLPTFGPLLKSTWSLRSLARSFQVSSFKRSSDGSSKESLPSGRASGSGQSSRASKGATPAAWTPVPVDKDITICQADMELDDKIREEEAGLPKRVTQAHSKSGPRGSEDVQILGIIRAEHSLAQETVDR